MIIKKDNRTNSVIVTTVTITFYDKHSFCVSVQSLVITKSEAYIETILALVSVQYK